MPNSGPVVDQLYFYPIKSFRGLKVEELELDASGALWDRQWMLVDANDRFLTQRQLPQLAKIGLSFNHESTLELSTADMGEIDFGLEEREDKETTVTVWRTEVPAFEVSGDVSTWLTEVVAQPVKLMRLSPNARRTFHPNYPERTVRFVDQQPLLVLSKAALTELEEKAGVTLSMIRFRPNLVIDQVPAHAEDEWAGFKIGDIEFAALKPCTRCKITTVHPLAGTVGEEPLKTLATYRRLSNGIHFGYYYAHLSEGKIKLGAPVSPH